MLVYFTLDLSCLNRGALTNLLQVITKKLGCHKETARCSVFLPAPNDSSIVIYRHCT